MAERGEPLVGLEEFTALPEAPRPSLAAGDKDRPRASRPGYYGMLVKRRTKANAAGTQPVYVTGVNIQVAAFKHQSNEPPRVVMVRSPIIGPQPVMQADGAKWMLKAPADEVRALRQAEPLSPCKTEKWYAGADLNNRPLLRVSSALPDLSYPRAAKASVSGRLPRVHM